MQRVHGSRAVQLRLVARLAVDLVRSASSLCR
ncbi:putative leader peptide [Kitasatospora sp. NPDC057015]